MNLADLEQIFGPITTMDIVRPIIAIIVAVAVQLILGNLIADFLKKKIDEEACDKREPILEVTQNLPLTNDNVIEAVSFDKKTKDAVA